MNRQETKRLQALEITRILMVLCCAIVVGCVRPTIPSPPKKGTSDTVAPVDGNVQQSDGTGSSDLLDGTAPGEICFSSEIVAVISAKCVGCHGGLVAKFELNGNPSHDYPLVLEKVNTSDPESSLFLKKALGEENHGGQAVLKKEDPEYATLLQWITAGAHETCTGGTDSETPDSDVQTPTDPPPCSANCHGYPPKTGMHEKHTNPKTYNFDCTTCHIFPDHHMSGSVDLGFTKSDPPNPSGVFSETEKRCSGLYCHGDGKSPTATGTIKWTDAEKGCDTCHKQANLSGKHQAHLGANLTCADCHKTASKDKQITDFVLHVSGKVDVDFSNTALNPNGNYKPTTKTCSEIYCHSDGKSPDGKGSIKWTDSGLGCDTCHSKDTLSGAHTRHLEVGKSCGDCHKMDANAPGSPDPLFHLNGKVDVKFDVAGLNPKGSYDDSTKTCSGLYCHGDGKTPQSIGTEVWTGGPLDCASCHKPDQLSGKHERHTKTYSFDCSECHKNVVKGENKLVDPFLHVNGTKEVSFEKSPLNPSGSYTSSSKSCTGLYCHSNGTNLNATGTAKWDAPEVGCNACHPKAQLSGKHSKHVATYDFACSECHKTAQDKTTIDPKHIGLHLNGTKDIAFDNSLLNKNTATYSVTKTCSGLYCHGDGKTVDSVGEVNWGDDSVGCASCHGQPPREMTLHWFHVEYKEINARCGHCHPSGSTTSNDVITNYGLHVNQIKDFKAADSPGFTFIYNDTEQKYFCTGSCHTDVNTRDHPSTHYWF